MPQASYVYSSYVYLNILFHSTYWLNEQIRNRKRYRGGNNTSDGSGGWRLRFHVFLWLLVFLNISIVVNIVPPGLLCHLLGLHTELKKNNIYFLTVPVNEYLLRCSWNIMFILELSSSGPGPGRVKVS